MTMLSLNKNARAKFTAIATDLVERQLWGAKNRRRSLGPSKTPMEATYRGRAFLDFARDLFPEYRFGVSQVEGTGGTQNLRVRVYCLGPASAPQVVNAS
jgi:hypothetical protein